MPSVGAAAEVELLLYLDKFTSVALLDQGLFYLSVTVGDTGPSTVLPTEALLCSASGHFSVASKEAEVTARNPRHNVIRARVDKAGTIPVYRSAAFVIKYQQEEVELRDATAYTLVVPLDSTALPLTLPPIPMSIALHYNSNMSCETHSELEEVARHEFKLNRLVPSTSVYHRCNLAGLHFATLDMTVHAAAVGFSFSAPLAVEDLPLLSNRHKTATTKLRIPRPLLDRFLTLLVDSHAGLQETAKSVILDAFSQNQQRRLDEIAQCPISPVDTSGPFVQSRFLETLGGLHDDILRIWTTLVSILSRTAAHQCEQLRIQHQANLGNHWQPMLRCGTKVIDFTKRRGHRSPEVTIAEAADVRGSSQVRERFSLPPVLQHCAVASEPRDLHVFFETVCHWPEDEAKTAAEDAWEKTRPQRPVQTAGPQQLLSYGRMSAPEVRRGRRDRQRTQLFVLVHGLQASALDIRMFRSYMVARDVPGHFLLARSLEDCTHLTVAEQASLLAKEVATHVAASFHRPPLISFVGHSLGAVIVRAALEEEAFRPLLPHLFTFVSLASPHLGVLLLDSSLISSGMKLYRRWMSSQSMAEVELLDTPDMDQAYFFGLSSAPGLGRFKNVLLVGSGQDKYVPLLSALLEPCADVRTPKEAVHNHMAQNMARVLREGGCNVTKVDVHYGAAALSGLVVQKFLGATEHTVPISDCTFMEMFLDLYRRFLVAEGDDGAEQASLGRSRGSRSILDVANSGSRGIC
mmetsp:Transcript_1620/g.5726  ORF Transcript_1620/g.5726 Transcript_1620/m.5726 type:complete len:747 (+) Transcript_1620:16-2256(+)